MKKSSIFTFRIALCLYGCVFFACNDTATPVDSTPPSSPSMEDVAKPVAKPVGCFARIKAADDSLGNVRNHACETITLTETIQSYTNSLTQLNFMGCSDDFISAFAKHRQAWLDLLPLTKKFPTMRGEMHILFEEIKKGEHGDEFKPLLKAVWDSWAEVEAAMPATE